MNTKTNAGWKMVDRRHYIHVSGAEVYKAPTKAFEYVWCYRMPSWKVGEGGIGSRASAMAAVERELAVIARNAQVSA